MAIRKGTKVEYQNLVGVVVDIEKRGSTVSAYIIKLNGSREEVAAPPSMVREILKEGVLPQIDAGLSSMND